MIYGYFGKMGQGKTLAMTAFGKDKYSQGYEIFSNYWVAFPHKPVYNPLDIVQEMALDQGKPKLFLFDELGSVLKILKILYGENLIKLFYGALFMRSRKAGIEVAYSSQRSRGQADKSIRDVTDVVGIPTKLPNGLIRVDEFECNGTNDRGYFELSKRLSRYVLWPEIVGKMYNSKGDVYLFEGNNMEKIYALLKTRDKNAVKEGLEGLMGIRDETAPKKKKKKVAN